MECTGQNQGRQEETHNTTHRFRRSFLDLLLMGWRGCASAMGVINNLNWIIINFDILRFNDFIEAVRADKMLSVNMVLIKINQ